jgi:aminoglycoside phosphotransferase (APT) family kinase protein
MTRSGPDIPAPGPVDAVLPDLDAALVRRLLAVQFPDWSGMAVVPVVPQGHDNRTFRVGESLLARLPSAACYAGQVAKEQRWLPWLARRLPVTVPRPRALGRPGEGYPFDWSVMDWLPGRPPIPADDLPRLAVDLAACLRALQAAPPAGGPVAGPQNFHRGGDLRVYDADTRGLLARLAGRIDAAAASALWDRALESAWQHAPVWVHGDVGAGNLLVENGRLAALIDFGSCGIGDPACDLTIAWTLFDAEARAAFRLALDYDRDTWTRARGWALWKALLGLDGEPAAAERHFAAIAALLQGDAHRG